MSDFKIYSEFFCGNVREYETIQQLMDHIQSDEHFDCCDIRKADIFPIHLANMVVRYGARVECLRKYWHKMDNHLFTISSSISSASREGTKPCCDIEQDYMKSLFVGLIAKNNSTKIIEWYFRDKKNYYDYDIFILNRLNLAKFEFKITYTKVAMLFAKRISRPFDEISHYSLQLDGCKFDMEECKKLMKDIVLSYNMAKCTAHNLKFTQIQQEQLLKTFYGVFLLMQRKINPFRDLVTPEHEQFMCSYGSFIRIYMKKDSFFGRDNY